jgi:hypothetical protein
MGEVADPTPEGLVYGRVMARLEAIAENLKGKDEKEDEEEQESGTTLTRDPSQDEASIVIDTAIDTAGK